jgi:hypothetical protein
MITLGYLGPFYFHSRPIPWASLIQKLLPISSDWLQSSGWAQRRLSCIHPRTGGQACLSFGNSRRGLVFLLLFPSFMGTCSFLPWDRGLFFRAAKLRHCRALTGLPVHRSSPRCRHRTPHSVTFPFPNKDIDGLSEWNGDNLSMPYRSKNYFRTRLSSWYRLCALATDQVVSGSIPGATRFSQKWWVWNGVQASWVQLRSYLEEIVTAPV